MQIPLSDRIYNISISSFAWIVYLFALIPTLLVIPISLGSTSELQFLPPSQWSLYLYEKLFSSQQWLLALWVSFQIAILSMFVALAVGVPAAYVIARGRFRGRELVYLVLLSPLFVPTIVLALAVYLYFSQLGLINTKFGLVISHTVLQIPYVIVAMTAGITQIDRNLEVAATIMGASKTRILTSVIIPQSKISLIASGLFAFMISFDEVTMSWFLSGAGTTTFPVIMYSSLKLETSPVIAAAAALLSVASIAICTLLVLVPSLNRGMKIGT